MISLDFAVTSSAGTSVITISDLNMEDLFLKANMLVVELRNQSSAFKKLTLETNVGGVRYVFPESNFNPNTLTYKK